MSRQIPHSPSLLSSGALDFVVEVSFFAFKILLSELSFFVLKIFFLKMSLTEDMVSECKKKVGS